MALCEIIIKRKRMALCEIVIRRGKWHHGLEMLAYSGIL